ncbi:MAG: DUF2922 domain-containing protein [Clostridium sp.]|nr:DUF2922 domain-containing protein [Clostridium sp.]
MDTIISKDIFKTSAGTFVKMSEAKLTDNNVTYYIVA